MEKIETFLGCFEYFPTKGGLISESFSLWLKSKKIGCQITPEHLLLRWRFESKGKPFID